MPFSYPKKLPRPPNPPSDLLKFTGKPLLPSSDVGPPLNEPGETGVPPPGVGPGRPPGRPPGESGMNG